MKTGYVMRVMPTLLLGLLLLTTWDLSFARQSGWQWRTLAEAFREAKQSNRKILVSFHTPKIQTDILVEAFLVKNPPVAAYVGEHYILATIDTTNNEPIEWNDGQPAAWKFISYIFELGMGRSSAILVTAGHKYTAALQRLNDPQYVLDALHYCVEDHYVTQSLPDYIDDCRKLRAGKSLFPWRSYEEGTALARRSHKKVLINAFWSVSQYSRRMKDITYADPGIKDYINDHFIPIQLDMDAKGPVRYGDRDMRPYTLLDNVLKVTGYPSTLFYDSDGTRLGVVSGDHKPDVFIHILDFYAGDLYKSGTLEAYLDRLGISEKK